MHEPPVRPLTDDEITRLRAQGCTATDWAELRVADGFRADRVRHAHFTGTVRLGAMEGSVAGPDGIDQPAGVYHAALHACTVGEGVRIARVGGHLAHLDIGDGAWIEDVGTVSVRPGATFGNGVEVEVLNEGGGREVILFNELDAQFAYLLCVHRYRTACVERLQAMARDAAARTRSDRGRIGKRARIVRCGLLLDVAVGEAARIEGAARLINGTVLSTADAPTTMGTSVEAEDFVIAEGSTVDGGAMLTRTFVGQGCRIGRQFSAEHCLFFANCEAFHGEAVSVFAGPYTVTHHRSSLLIAGLFSFYNAGSGTNQSNHMYKLGPVHEGRLERGSKTGSFSYMMWPCRVGPFSVVLGKHTRSFDTSSFPFSHIEAAPDGRSLMVPGFNLSTVGTVRDGAKWPARDRRTGAVKRDRISFDVLSPFTVGRMIEGSSILERLQEETSRSVDAVTIDGVTIKRVLLRSGRKFYRPGIEMYLLERVAARLERGLEEQPDAPLDALAVAPEAVFSREWIDLGGQLLPRDRLDALCARIEQGGLDSPSDVAAALDAAASACDEDAWAWVRWAVGEVFDVDLDVAGPGELVRLLDDLEAVRGKFLRLVLLDARKEFDDQTRTGFGHDGADGDAEADFRTVRGAYEENGFVRQMQEEAAALAPRMARLKHQLSIPYNESDSHE